jgi:hypothetical protein
MANSLNKDLIEIQSEIKSEVNIFNEISILIVDRKRFELLPARSGREIAASPLRFMLTEGGNLPRVDFDSVLQASISSDNRVWGFHGRTQWQDILINGVRQSTVYYDFYRVYVMNDAYLYQITLGFIPNLDQPADTWQEMVKSLQSLRILAEMKG